MRILGIESSCDETAVAIVRDGRDVDVSLVASQIDRHAPFGGVVPEIASREHLKAIDPLVQQALTTSSLDDIDAIAVSQGPGLIGALLVGVSYAKGLAVSRGIPLIPVDHVHAHVHGALLGVDVGLEEIFPCLALVVSGGHTNLYFMREPTQFDLLASTIDDACGECFDKVGKLLGLPYPGGPHIENIGSEGSHAGFPMPKAMEEKDRLAFSFSGLKTYMANSIRKLEREETLAERRADLCASFQEAALGQIVRKLKRAYQLHPEAKSILVAGGVAANQRFRTLVADAIRLPSHFPAPKYCADNGAMIAALAYHQWQAGEPSSFSNMAWDAYSRYRYEA